MEKLRANIPFFTWFLPYLKKYGFRHSLLYTIIEAQNRLTKIWNTLSPEVKQSILPPLRNIKIKSLEKDIVVDFNNNNKSGNLNLIPKRVEFQSLDKSASVRNNKTSNGTTTISKEIDSIKNNSDATFDGITHIIKKCDTITNTIPNNRTHTNNSKIENEVCSQSIYLSFEKLENKSS